MTNIKLKSISFGDPTAEGDRSFLFDRNCFLETDIYERCASLDAPQFVVGRRGSGKSATRMALTRKFANQSGVLSIVVAPQGFHFAHAKSLAKLLMIDTGVSWEFLFTSIWATIFRSAWAEALSSYYRVRETSEGDLDTLREYIRAVNEPNATPIERLSNYLQRVSDLASSPGGDLVGRVQNVLNSLRSEKIGATIARVAEASEVKLVLLIDNLDENWDGTDTSAQLISGLLTQCANEYASIGAVSSVFIRENMYRRVSEMSSRWDRIEGYFVTVNWSTHQLKSLILTRLRRSLSDESIQWNDVFDEYVDGKPCIDYLIGRTQAKPREVILFCRYALSTAVRDGEQKISQNSVLDAEKTYSENRYRDLINEYKDALPELNVVLDTFISQPIVFTLDELFRILTEFMASGRYAVHAPRLSLTHPNPETLFDLLLGIGFLGVRQLESKDFIFKFYGQQGNAFGELSDIADVAIHPAFYVALGAKAHDAIAGELVVREAADQDLVSASTPIAARVAAADEHAKEIIAMFEGIPLGLGGFRRYEEHVRDALAYAFTSYLDNPRLQDRNWAGTQVRDIVFDNTGETLFFKHVRDKYNAIAFVFECKNKTELEAADFHQIEARLSDATGNLGFICFRAPRLDPIASEIEQIRSIFNRSHSQKLVLILTDSNIDQLICRRLKGKLDQFLYRLMTRYLTKYLSS